MSDRSSLIATVLTLTAIVTVTLIFVIRQWPDQYYHIVGCDVGQGDAFLFSFGFQQWLVDTGPDESVVSCLGKFMPFWDKKIEVVMISHADKDHVGGLLPVLLNYQIETLIMNPTKKDTSNVQQLEEKLVEIGLKPQFLFRGQSMSLTYQKKDVQFQTYWPEENHYQKCKKSSLKCETLVNPNQNPFGIDFADENNLSISGVLTLGEVEIMLTGDIDQEVELAIIDDDLLPDIDIIKASHHGSKYSTHVNFISTLRPETALIGVGRNNTFGHPSTRVIDLFRYNNINIFTTAEQGSLHFMSDGQRYWQVKE